MITDPLALAAILTAVVWVALQLERRLAAFKALGAALVGILLGMVLSNTGLVPGTSPTYDWLSSTGVSLAVVLILLNVDLDSIRSAGPRMFVAFLIGAVATAVGALIGFVTVGRAVGPEGWKLAGQFTDTYTGGGMNFAALGRAFDTSADLFTAAVAADVALTAVWMAACLVAPLLIGRSAIAASDDDATDDAAPVSVAQSLTSSIQPVVIADLAALIAIAAAALWTAGWLANTIPALPEVLWLSTIALGLAQIAPIRKLHGGALLGNYLLLLFLAANGAQSVLANIFRVGPAVFWFAAITITVHGVGIFGIGKLMGIDAGTLAVASQANVGGPASAVALAGARGYADRVLPGVAVGLLGYAVGNYSGFLIANLVRTLL
ncbi:MAG: DUF819 family protein [Acidobacteria bacterium]|nr:DUF819 family protein [Acidobacteriota bacterium]